MKRFVKAFVVPLLDGKRWRMVCEIGASLGEEPICWRPFRRFKSL
jgi:hypothetical protein